MGQEPPGKVLKKGYALPTDSTVAAVFQRPRIDLFRIVTRPLPSLVDVFRGGAELDTVRASRIHAKADRRGSRFEPEVEIRRIDEIGFSRDHAAAHFAGAAQDVTTPGKHVVQNPRRAGASLDEQEAAAGRPVVHHGVVHEVEFVQRVLEPLGAVGDYGGIFGFGPVLDQVADHERKSAVGQVDGVARAAVAFVHDAVVANVVPQRAALDVVSDERVMNVAETQREGPDVADVEVVGVAVTGSVARQFRTLDDDIARPIEAGQDAILVVVYVAIADRQAGAFEPDGGAVAVGYLRAGKLHGLDGGVVALDDPDPLALGLGAGRANVGAPAHAAEYEPALPPDRGVAFIDTGVDLDDIPIAGDPSGITRNLHFALRADAQYRRLRPVTRLRGIELPDRRRARNHQGDRKRANECSHRHSWRGSQEQ